MLRLIEEVDKTVNELTLEEVKRLEWSTVPDSELAVLRDDYILLCDRSERIFNMRKCDSMSNSTALKLIYKAAFEEYPLTAKHYTDLCLREAVEEWCSDEFLKKNIGFFQRIRNKDKFPYFEIALAQCGIININTIDVPYSNIDAFQLNDIRISTEERFEFLKKTNFLAYHIKDIPEYVPICLPNNILQELNLPYPGDCYINKSDYEIDPPSIDMMQDLPVLKDKLYWDEVLDLYLKGMIKYETVSNIWADIFEEYPHLTESTLFSSSFMRPGMNMKTTRGRI